MKFSLVSLAVVILSSTLSAAKPNSPHYVREKADRDVLSPFSTPEQHLHASLPGNGATEKHLQYKGEDEPPVHKIVWVARRAVTDASNSTLTTSTTSTTTTTTTTESTTTTTTSPPTTLFHNTTSQGSTSQIIKTVTGQGGERSTITQYTVVGGGGGGGATSAPGTSTSSSSPGLQTNAAGAVFLGEKSRTNWISFVVCLVAVLLGGAMV